MYVYTGNCMFGMRTRVNNGIYTRVRWPAVAGCGVSNFVWGLERLSLQAVKQIFVPEGVVSAVCGIGELRAS